MCWRRLPLFRRNCGPRDSRLLQANAGGQLHAVLQQQCCSTSCFFADMYVQSCVHPIFVTVSSCVEPMMANVTSRPQSPLAIFSPALRLMCVEARTFTVICSAAFLLPFALCCAAAPHSSWCCRAQCGATGELRDMLLRCLRGIDLVETWRNSFKNLRKIILNGLQDIYRFARPVRASQGRDTPALRALFVAVQALRDNLVLLDPIGEQQYMSHNLNQCLDRMSVPSQGPVGDIARFGIFRCFCFGV